MPWKRRNNDNVGLKRAALLAGLSVAAGILACWISSCSQKAFSGFAEKAAAKKALAGKLSGSGR